MKSINYSTRIEKKSLNGLNFTSEFEDIFQTTQKINKVYANTQTQITPENLLTTDAYISMAAGLIPDLWKVCHNLFQTFFINQAPFSAVQFIPVLENLHAIDGEEVIRFIKNRETRHILVENELMKVVLIHWKPGKVSAIHGHPKGGCAFKVLQGKLEELRYSADSSQKLLSSNGYRAGSIAYIDDRLGHHAVGNPFGSSAISIHAYTPGN